MNQWVDEVQMWNEDRDNLDYNHKRERDMIAEELLEYDDAYIKDDLVGQVDALADLLVVTTGSLYKLLKGNKQAFDEVMLSVTATNNLKSSTKNAQGKITKPKDFIGPEKQIKKILEACGCK